METETLYFNKHIILFQHVLKEIINYNKNTYDVEDRYYNKNTYDENDKYIWNDDYGMYENGNDKLYNNYDDYEDYWDSIYN